MEAVAEQGSRLLDSISAFCRSSGIAESTFGRRAVNDGEFVARLRDGAPSRNFRFFDNRQKYLVPHIAARRIRDRAELQAFLARATREIGLPGYPEGHPRIPAAALESAFAEKLSLAAAHGMGTYVVTQFSFAPSRVVDYCARMARQAPGVPIYVGLAGPTTPVALLRFAQRCGVSASLRALGTQGMNAVRLVTHTDPADPLSALARYCASHANCNVVGVHLFTFGGVSAAAHWINRQLTPDRARGLDA